MKIRSAPLRFAIGIVLLGALYWWSYSQGIVSDVTSRLGVRDPGPLLIGAPATPGPLTSHGASR